MVLVSYVGVATPVIAALVVGLQGSCRMLSPRVTYRWIPWKKSSARLEPRAVFAFVTEVPVISPKQFCFLRRSIVLSFRATKSISIGTRTQDSFRACYLSSCNLLAETNKFCLGAVLSCLVSELQKPSSSGLESRTVFGVVAFVPVISSPKRTTLVLAPFLYRP
jgi:hypothetical protein